MAIIEAVRGGSGSEPAHERHGSDESRSISSSRRGSDSWQRPEIPDLFRAGPFTLDDCCKRVWVDGKKRLLSPKEYILFKLLVMDAGHVVSREEIIARLWPESHCADNSDVLQCVRRLRGKVEKNPRQPSWIQNVRGVGYRLAVSAGE